MTTAHVLRWWLLLSPPEVLDCSSPVFFLEFLLLTLVSVVAMEEIAANDDLKAAEYYHYCDDGDQSGM